jgi:hypothetical protein
VSIICVGGIAPPINVANISEAFVEHCRDSTVMRQFVGIRFVGFIAR